ncbi:hypothetical protein CC86DRAFT_381547 [Ophiobolus disseminans]|uniref:Mid2 domain-containing protein n=1 Tax=Ophiobolus disseminans TaxID=1469910 RepID=A0A6A7A427_9PLEO|nr:hypothetical protein CC86DRAFT_381547 [Ophiobolus disseminans]
MAARSLFTLVLLVLSALCFDKCASEILPGSNDGRDVDLSRRPAAQNATMRIGNWENVSPPTTMAPFLDQSQQGLAARAAHLFKRACPFTDASKKVGNCADQCCTNGVYGWCCNSMYVCGDGQSSTFCKYDSIATSTLTVTGTTAVVVTTTEAQSSPGTTVLSTITSTVVVTITRSDLETATEVRTIITTVDPRKRGIAGIPSPTQPAILSTPSAEAAKKEQQKPLAITDVSPNPRAHGRFFKRQTKTTPTVTSTRMVYVTAIRSVTVTSISVYAVTSTTATTITSTSTAAVNAKTTVTRTTTLTSTRGVTPAGGVLTGPTPSDGSGGNTNSGGSNDSGNPTDGNNGGNSGLSTGAKAGIGIGAGLGALVLGLLAAFLILRRRRQRKAETDEKVAAAVLAATAGGHNSMASPPMADKYYQYPHSNGTMSPPPPSSTGGYEMEGSQVGTQYPQSWNGSQGYEMAGTQSPSMGHAQPVFNPAMQQTQPGLKGQAMPHYAGQPQVYEMSHEPLGQKRG